MIVSKSLQEIGATIINVELGKVTIASDTPINHELVRNTLEKNGFELIADKNEILLEKIKSILIDFTNPDRDNEDENISSYLSKKMNRDYAFLSKLFSKTEGISIEKYVINLKIEKTKELIQMNHLSFSEIAYTLGYKSSSHLARQFKNQTGLSMSEYKNLQNWDRKSLDQIV
jgi:hypothetical protein